MLVGVAENALNVPLFAELYGYGPFLGRRNIGTRDPLFCRVMTFNDGNRRNMIVTTDAVVTDDLDARILRAQIAAELGLLPKSIMFVATHTHSGPAMSLGIGWGEMNQEYLAHWRTVVRQTAREAVASEEEVSAIGGRAKLSKKLGYNRANSQKNQTDPEIRWIKLVRSDNSVKALIHNHGMHGVCYGPDQLRVSADWMGEANRVIKERKLAEIPFFIYGAAGDINFNWKKPFPESTVADRDQELYECGQRYVNDLEKSLTSGGVPVELGPLQAAFDTVELPTCIETADELRRNAELLKEVWPFASKRYTEMAVLADQGKDFRVFKDLQVLRMGDFALYAFPGEPFVQLGVDIMEKSPFNFAMPAGVANGNGRYFPIKETFDRNPSLLVDASGAAIDYGYYEIWAGAGRYMPRYQDNIADFIVGKLLELQLK